MMVPVVVTIIVIIVILVVVRILFNVALSNPVLKDRITPLFKGLRGDRVLKQKFLIADRNRYDGPNIFEQPRVRALVFLRILDVCIVCHPRFEGHDVDQISDGQSVACNKVLLLLFRQVG